MLDSRSFGSRLLCCLRMRCAVTCPTLCHPRPCPFSFFIAAGNEKQMRGTPAIGGTETADRYAPVVFLDQSPEKSAFSFIARKRLNLHQLKIGAQVIKMPASLFLKLNMPFDSGLQISFCAPDIHVQSFPKRKGPQFANGNIPVIFRHQRLDRIEGMPILQSDRKHTFHLLIHSPASSRINYQT